MALKKENGVFRNSAESSDKKFKKSVTCLTSRSDYSRRTKNKRWLIQTYNIMTGREAIEREQFFQLLTCEYNLRRKKKQYEVVKTASQSWCPQVLFQSACGEWVEPVASRGCGCCICEPVQEPSGQELAKIWSLKAWLNKPINGQVQVSK